ncbi:hypothetical protein GCM10010274_65540 [Streptomyces lavendofoliae]|uniref:MFS transporter n=1 Tax=Streptomyces lavendofoliae TaxID=67314 RepID=A0A918I6C5_9ACTN|nr:hypothetical protein GCM10010274_65540 [Streptomyces lavendofoliae]
MLAAGAVVLAVFVAQQRAKTAKDGSALVALSLFKSKAFAGGLAAQLVFGPVSGVFLLTWVLFMQSGLGLTPGQFAPASVAISIGGMAGAMLASKWAGAHLRRVPQAARGRLGLLRPIMWLLRARFVPVGRGRGAPSDADRSPSPGCRTLIPGPAGRERITRAARPNAGRRCRYVRRTDGLGPRRVRSP